MLSRHAETPALVMLSECDMLRDEGAAYAARLQDAGVPTRVHMFRGAVHGLPCFGRVVPASLDALDLVAETLQEIRSAL